MIVESNCAIVIALLSVGSKAHPFFDQRETKLKLGIVIRSSLFAPVAIDWSDYHGISFSIVVI